MFYPPCIKSYLHVAELMSRALYRILNNSSSLLSNVNMINFISMIIDIP